MGIYSLMVGTKPAHSPCHCNVCRVSLVSPTISGLESRQVRLFSLGVIQLIWSAIYLHPDLRRNCEQADLSQLLIHRDTLAVFVNQRNRYIVLLMLLLLSSLQKKTVPVMVKKTPAIQVAPPISAPMCE